MIDLRKEFKEVPLTTDELIELMPERTIEYFLVRRLYKSLISQKFSSEIAIYDCHIEYGITESKVRSIIWRK